MYEIKARGSTDGVTVCVCVFFAYVSMCVSGTLYLEHISFCQCLVWNCGHEDDPTDSFKHLYGSVFFKCRYGQKHLQAWVCVLLLSGTQQCVELPHRETSPNPLTHIFKELC